MRLVVSLLALLLVAAGLLLLVLSEQDDARTASHQSKSSTEMSTTEMSTTEVVRKRGRERGRLRAASEAGLEPAVETRLQESRPGLGTIEGRVVDHTDAPVVGAVLRPAPRWGSSWEVTDADGAFRLIDVTPGAGVVLWCLHPELRTGSSEPIEVTPGATSSGVVVSLPVPDPVEIVGRVLSHDGSVLTDARTGYGIHVGAAETVSVSLGTVFMQLPKDETPAGRLRTAIQARFSLADRPDGTFRYVVDRTARTITVRANHADFMYGRSDYTVFGPERSRIELDVVLLPERWVEGRVSDDDDVPAEGVEIRFNSKFGSDSEPLATTDARGRFRFRLDNADQDTIKAYKTGYVRSEVRLSTAGEEGVAVRIRREVPWAGRVVFADGTPARGADVRAISAEQRNAVGNDSYPLPRTESDDEGRFSLPLAFERAWMVIVHPGDHPASEFVPVTLPWVRPSDGSLEVRVEPGLSIEGRVVDDAGQPLAGVFLSCEREDGDGRRREAITGREGRFHLGGLSAGGISIHVAPMERTGGFIEKTFSDVIAGTTGLDLVVARGGSIRGVVVDAEGRPVAGRGIIATPADRSRFVSPGRPVATTDAHGRFEVTGLEPVPQRLLLDSVYPHRRLRYLEGGEDVAPGTSDLHLVLSYGHSLHLQVFDAMGRPLANQQIGVRDVRFNDISDSAFYGGRALLRTDAEGRANIAGLHPAHAYDVTVDASGHVRYSRAGVRAGPAEIQIRLEASSNDD